MATRPTRWLNKIAAFFRPSPAEEQKTPPFRKVRTGSPDGRAVTPVDLLRFTPGAPVFSADTATKLNKIRHYRGWVYVAVRAIAEKISQLRPTVGVKQKVGFGKSKHLTKAMRHRLKATTIFSESEDVEPLEDHPLALLLDDPNEPETSADLWYKTIM